MKRRRKTENGNQFVHFQDESITLIKKNISLTLLEAEEIG